ncbi:MAG TPA: acyl-[ACP]--phospholipid O-acyltransferase [Rhodospirillaceae bacterium]|nr:MAG: 2-acyl-glycerophospho-ethanolamine acyltransferase [Alphaproteobacteria bacterium GWF2_58_20]HAU29667.1 acyl-[ACP]--phospholipid O-acyltransferase [Rhodospirillaceae bacterium]
MLGKKRFLPLFVSQFLGALNDNFFKTAIVMFITFTSTKGQAIHGLNAAQLITLAAGIFMLPFFLFSATAGQLADKFEKARLTRIIKVAEIFCMLLGAIGLVFKLPIFLIFVLFLMGTQSTFFGPLKYSLLPEHLADDELIGGNALISAGTFIAILLGTIMGGFVTVFPEGMKAAAVAVVVFAIVGWGASLFIPYTPARAKNIHVSWNIPREIASMLRFVAERDDIYLCILGISWFWLIGSAFLSQFPTFAKNIIGGGEMVATLFLSAFSVGIGAGALLCNRILRGKVVATYVPIGALGITVFGFDLFFASSHFPSMHDHVVGIVEFLSRARGIRVFVDLVMIALFGGIFIIPLNAMLQHRSEESHRSRVIAANNIVNALFMVVSAAIITLVLHFGFTPRAVFFLVAFINIPVIFYSTGLLPEVLLKNIMRIVFRVLCRVEVRGMENLEKAGDRVVIVVNHASFIDPPLLATFLPGMPVFAINTQMARKWWVRPFLRLVKVVPMDPTKPLLIKSLIRMVRSGRPCIIFPEGRITVTGSLMKIYEGPGLIADMADAKIVPIRIEGAQYSRFSRLSGKVRRRHLFPKITLTILEPRGVGIPPSVVGHARRHLIGLKLYDVMSGMIFETCDTDRPLFKALLDSRDKHGGNCKILEDVAFQRMDYARLITSSFIMGRKLKRLAYPGGYVGVMLPTSIAMSVTFFALHAYARVPAMINFTFGLKNILSACNTAGISAIITSRSFVEKARLQDVVAELEKRLQIIFLEDIKESVTSLDKARGLFRTYLTGRMFFNRRHVRSDDPAVVLFTSGSEGMPKGVVLSHRNLLANYYQISARIDFTSTDVVFNALPMFHSFGLLAGTLLPIFSGIRTFLYPSPLHYRIVPELSYDTNATIIFGTDTFLSGYARAAHPYDFYSVRYVVAGAEKLREETRKTWFEKFGLRILEGYGVTETSPVISINTPMHYRSGTVGRMMPGMMTRLEKVPGIEEGGRLYVKGDNVMLGYMLSDAPGYIQPPLGGWHDTGDIVNIDEDGYLTIAGRAKRFAKIGGEMVSLGAVEGVVGGLWPRNRHIVVNLPDSRKGEKLVLMTDKGDAAREPIIHYMREQGCSDLMIPALIMVVDSVPVLGSGKIDYVTAREMVEQRLG